MSIPLDIDPGHNNPRSPLFIGCEHCGRFRKPSPCSACQRRRKQAISRDAALDEHDHNHRQLEIAKHVTEPDNQRSTGLASSQHEDEDRILEHRAEAYYRAYRERRANA